MFVITYDGGEMAIGPFDTEANARNYHPGSEGGIIVEVETVESIGCECERCENRRSR